MVITLVGNGAEDRALAAAAAEDVDAEAGDVAELEGEVDVVGLLEVAAQAVRHDVEHHVVDLLGRQRRVLEALHVAVDAHPRRLAGGQVDVGRARAVREGQQLGDVHIRPNPSAPSMGIRTLEQDARQLRWPHGQA